VGSKRVSIERHRRLKRQIALTMLRYSFPLIYRKRLTMHEWNCCCLAGARANGATGMSDTAGYAVRQRSSAAGAAEIQLTARKGLPS
jgi:hypothetical protein